MFIISITFLCLLTTEVQAQDFKTAAGLRLGSPFSLSVKHFFTENSAIEGFVGTRGYQIPFGGKIRFLHFGATYQRHQPLEVLEGLSAFYGAGASYILITAKGDSFNNSENLIGINASGGLSYTFEDLPVNISLEWAPTVFIGENTLANGIAYANIAVRYVFAR